VGSLARHQAEIFPRLGVPADEGWMLASIVALGYPTGRWAVDVLTASGQLIGRVRFRIDP